MPSTPRATTRRFGYLRDPLFLTAVSIWAGNRWLCKPLVAGGFVHDHVNDLVCIAFWVPPMLWLLRCIGLRRHDEPPDGIEILVPLIVWSLVFEVLLPTTGPFQAYARADHRDIWWYTVGALGAGLAWRLVYRDLPESTSRTLPRPRPDDQAS